MTLPRRVDPASTSFTTDLPGLGAEGSALLRRIGDAAVAESCARGIALSVIRMHGVTVPLRAFQRMPRPLDRISSLVLDKLAAVAVHLGAP